MVQGCLRKLNPSSGNAILMEILFLGFVLFVSLLRLVKVIRVKPKVNCIPQNSQCTQRTERSTLTSPAPSATQDNSSKGSLKPSEQGL